MVINVGWVKEKQYDLIEHEIREIKKACDSHVLKVIIETCADIELFSSTGGNDVKIKAAGGISSVADAERFLGLGADRLGTSRIVKIAKENEER